MTLDSLVAILTALSLQANPSVHAIPTTVNTLPMAADVVMPQSPIKRRPESLGVATTAKSAIVVDVGSGAVLYAKDAKVERPIASLTKLMTAMVVLDQGLRPDELITIQGEDFEAARPDFMAGDTLTRRDALRAMLTVSANEIANAFARTSSPSAELGTGSGRAAFIDAMNEKAATLGLDHTLFEEPTGINPRNRATAVDVARLLRSALAYPEIREMTTQGRYDAVTQAGRVVRMDPTNLLLPSYLNQSPYRIVAGKTGSLPEAGYCLAQTTQNGDGKQIITVVLGSTDHFVRFQDVKALTSWAFDTYEWK